MSAEKRSKLLFYTLGFSTAAGGPPLVVLSLILIDVAESLNVSVGVCLGRLVLFPLSSALLLLPLWVS